MGIIVQSKSINNEITKPVFVPKNCLNIAPVYPKSAEISSFNRISVRDKSIGLNIVAMSENESNGYSSKTINDIRNNPS